MSAKSFTLLLLQFITLIPITLGGIIPRLIPVSDLIRGPAFWTDNPIPSTGLQYFGTGTATFAIPHFTLDTTDFSYPLPTATDGSAYSPTAIGAPPTTTDVSSFSPTAIGAPPTTTGVSSFSPTAILTLVVETVVTSDVTIQPPVISTSAVESSATSTTTKGCPLPSAHAPPLNSKYALDIVVDTLTPGGQKKHPNEVTSYWVRFFSTPYGQAVGCRSTKQELIEWAPRQYSSPDPTPWDIGGVQNVSLPGVGECQWKNEGTDKVPCPYNIVNSGKLFCGKEPHVVTIDCGPDPLYREQQLCGDLNRTPLITCPYTY